MNIAAKIALTIRPEISQDYGVIYDLTKRAFATMPFADGDEQDLINTLRSADVLSLSLVALYAGRLVGHIAFSPAAAEKPAGHWYALGPVSVEPELQRQGIGSALIYSGLDILKQREAEGCILVGNPEYYQRFGFYIAPENCPADQPEQYYQILPIMANERAIKNSGNIGFHPIFYGA